MSIPVEHVAVGKQVRYAHTATGYGGDTLNIMQSGLEPGKVYTIAATHCGTHTGRITLEGVPGQYSIEHFEEA